MNPTESDAHNRLATNYKALKQKKSAIKHFRFAIKCDKSNKTAYNNLGNMYSVNEDEQSWNVAQQCYIKAIAINSNYSSVHANYGVLLRKMGRINDAKHHYLCALRISPFDAWIHFNFGNLMEEELGDNEAAAIHYRRCLEIDEEHTEALHNFAVLLHRKREWDEARKYYERALRFDAESILTRRNYALLLIALKKEAAAYHQLTFALSLCLKNEWNQRIDFMDCAHLTQHKSECTEIVQLIQHIFNENRSLFEDYEEGKKIFC